MYAKLVKIDGHEIWVSCVPLTPLWQVLERAAAMLKRDQR